MDMHEDAPTYTDPAVRAAIQGATNTNPDPTAVMRVYLDTTGCHRDRVYVALDNDTIHMIDSDGGIYPDLTEIPHTARMMEIRRDQTAE